MYYKIFANQEMSSFFVTITEYIQTPKAASVFVCEVSVSGFHHALLVRCSTAWVLIICLLIQLYCDGAAELPEWSLLAPLSVYLWVLADWIMSMRKVFLGCLADVTMPLINTLQSPYARQEQNDVAHLLRDKVLVCATEGRECGFVWVLVIIKVSGSYNYP